MEKHEFTVFFKIYGKKLKATVSAVDEIHAMDIVKTSINIVKVKKLGKDIKKSGPFEGLENIFDDLLDLLGKKK